jgi:hypothetical protein
MPILLLIFLNALFLALSIALGNFLIWGILFGASVILMGITTTQKKPTAIVPNAPQEVLIQYFVQQNTQTNVYWE